MESAEHTTGRIRREKGNNERIVLKEKDDNFCAMSIFFVRLIDACVFVILDKNMLNIITIFLPTASAYPRAQTDCKSALREVCCRAVRRCPFQLRP